MKIAVLTPEDAKAVVLDRQLAGYVVEGDQDDALAFAILRQATARLAPCRRSTLVNAVSMALNGLIPEEIRNRIDTGIDALVASGDIVLGTSDAGDRQRMIYAAPAMFVRRSEDSVFLIGHVPDEVSTQGTVTMVGPYREMRPAPPAADLEALGLTELPVDAWMIHPVERTALGVKEMLTEVVSTAGPPGTVNELVVIDPQRRNDFYVGRFVPASGMTGLFVGRRKRVWGGSQWVCVQLEGGEPHRMVDLPVLDRRFPARDEANWVICALDAVTGNPQRVIVDRQSNIATLSFSIPLPAWAEKRLLTVGRRSDVRLRGALFSIEIRTSDLEGELAFLQSMLWMEAKPA